jgi:hypothetical protein
MEQRSSNIRQNTELNRVLRDAPVNVLENQGSFDLKSQVQQHPWMAFGAAVVAGYVLGSMGDDQPHYARTSEYRSASSNKRLFAQFDDEIGMLKTAAIAAGMSYVRSSIKEYAPALGDQLEQRVTEHRRTSGKTPTSAPNAAFDEDARNRSANYDEIPSVQTRYGAGTGIAHSGSEYYDVAADTTRRHQSGTAENTEDYTP